ncbi:MAG: RimK family alpha-L-glutamate ligase [Thermoprotei archaeon]|nr:MAG: RimK family alpha-L-glutamate ligase [Thermoprotei archaeon]RLE99940.1 MAG: RimK family alpha-L-glutamate ligase [Thermoprotei archaeon]
MIVAVAHEAPLPPTSCRRLLEAIKRKRHRGVYISLPRLGSWISEDPVFTYGTRRLELDAVLLRSLGLTVSVEQLLARIAHFTYMELCGTLVVNSPKALLTTRNKYLTLAILKRRGLPVPKTFVTEHLGAAYYAAKELKEIVVKPIVGSRGYGSVKINDPDIAFEVFKTLLCFKKPLYIQKYMEKPNRDIRAFIIGGSVAAAMYRYAAPGCWKTNIAQGGRGEKCSLPEEYAEIAIKAAEYLELDYAGVDIIETRDGPLIVEVNGSPDFEELCRVTGVDIPLLIVNYIEEKARK